MSDDAMWTPTAAADHADDNPRVIANRLGALIRDVNDGFESIREALKTFARIELKLDVVIDRQNETDRVIAEIRREQARTDARLTALEAKKRRKPAGKK